jgi:exosortase/archaeosortase family protein
MLFMTDAMFGGRREPPGPALLWLASWSGLVVLTAASSLLGVLGGARWLRVLGRDLRVALPVGLLVWLGGLATATLWQRFDALTLGPTVGLLRMVTGHASANIDTSLLHLEHWTMRVAPGCAGYEGFGILLALGTAYSLRFRRELPPTALAVLIVGLVAVWLVNVLRFVTLSLLGNALGPAFAVASFHSKTSWVLFSGVALVCLAWVRLLLTPAARNFGHRAAPR